MISWPHPWAGGRLTGDVSISVFINVDRLCANFSVHVYNLLVSELGIKCKDSKTLKPCLFFQVMQMKGNGSNTAQHLSQRVWRPHCLGLVCLWAVESIRCGGWKLLAVHSTLPGRASWGIQFPQKGTLSLCPWATEANHSKGIDGDTCYRAAPDPGGNALGDTHSEDERAENLPAKVVFAVAALLTHLWRVSLLASSLSVLWEWSPWLLPLSHHGNRGLLCCSRAPCVHRCIVEGGALGKDEVFIPYTVKWLLKVNHIVLLAMPLFRINWRMLFYIVLQFVKASQIGLVFHSCFCGVAYPV